MKFSSVPTLVDIEKAHKAIAPYIHRTPVLTNSYLNELAGCSIYFKCENFQKVGAFKMRGAACAALSLSKEELTKGLCTHSSGNHAQAVAKIAQALGTKAYIVMPEGSPVSKKEATQGYGAEVIPCENTLAAREETLAQVQERTGANFIHPFNNYNVIAGQATTAKELIEDTEQLDVLMAPVGGGGLMSGTALSTHYLLPKAIAVGSEPELVDDAYRSMQSGRIEKNTRIDTIADGLRTNLGDKTFGIINKHVDRIIRVTEEEIIAAMRLIWERMKIIIEPSCAVPLAALLKEKEAFAGKQVGIILTGGNVDLEKLPF